jgi:DNA polymerase I-like protein with 3'-5' exonuclease and polymerase domains
MRADENLRALAKEVQAKLGRMWAEMFSVMERWLLEARGRGILTTGYVTGRVVRFPLRDRKHVPKTEVFNLPVQTTARELVCRAADRIDRQLPEGAALCADVHDALAAYCLKEQADEVLEILKSAMDTEFMGVKIIGKPQMGDNLLVVK